MQVLVYPLFNGNEDKTTILYSLNMKVNFYFKDGMEE